ncbi:MAG: leucine-rich repeat protein [Acutalibacteraceae bacterium]
MKKTLLKILALVMTAVLAFTIVHFAVMGNNTPSDTAFTFAVQDDGSAVLTGSADALSGAVVLPAEIGGYTVTGIGENAFQDCTDVTAFFLPDTITSIGDYAFENCIAMAQILLPESLVSIGAGAFWNCDSLVSVTVPATVTSIGSCAFYKCDALQSVIIPGASTPVSGIFNVALDIGQVLSFASAASQSLDPIITTVYCYNGSAAFYDTIADAFTDYILLDECETTSYTVQYVDESGSAVASECTVSVQPVGIPVAAVAVPVEDDTLLYPEDAVCTITLASGENTIVFVYAPAPETTTETTTEEPTTEEPTTEEPTTEEPTTEEPTTEEPTTEEPTTEEPTTEEPTTEPPRVPPVLYAREGSSTVIDRNQGYIYGLETGLNAETLESKYLEVRGEGHLELSKVPGTGCEVFLVSDIDGQIVEKLTIVIFGDVNGDSYINTQDITMMKHFASCLLDPADNPVVFFAADVFQDGSINNSDITIAKSVFSCIANLDQATLTYSKA